MTTLAVYCFAHNLVDALYPIGPCLTSALALTRYVNGGGSGRVFCAICDCTDTTEKEIRREFLGEILSGELKVVYHPWGSHFSIQAFIANYLLDEIGTSSDWAFKLDMDEVIHEGSFQVFKGQLEDVSKTNRALVQPRYIHFSPDFETTWPFIYSEKSVISRTASGIRFNTNPKNGNADACGLGGYGDYQSDLICHHYGKVHVGREVESTTKENLFQALYSHPEDALGFPDPKVVARQRIGYMDYLDVFGVDYAAGKFKPFTGTHPIFMKEWIEKMKLRSNAFWEEHGKVEA
jgi:hypothetical protein